MERLARVQQQIENLEDLREVVGGIRSISAARSQQALAVLAGARRHAEIVADALHASVSFLGPEVGASAPGEPGSPELMVVFASEHGFVGGFNEQLVEELERRLAGRQAELLVVGSRGAQVAQEHGLELARATPMTTHARGLLPLARRVSAEVEAHLAAGRTRVEVLFMIRRSAGQHRPEWLPLLPLDLSGFGRDPAALPPMRNLPSEVLLERLVEEYVLAELVRAGSESLASENGARLLAMANAFESAGDKLEDLSRLAAQLRQDEITTELLDIVTGAEALLEDED